MHYSGVNAVNAASPASASPSSSSLSPMGSSLVGNQHSQHSHSTYQQLSSNDGPQSSSMSQHHSDMMATMSPVTGGQQHSYNSNNGLPNSGSNKSEPMCDDLASSTATYTTLQSSSAPNNTHNGHYAQQTSGNQQNSMAPNNSSQAASKGVKRSAPSTTATKSTYSNGKGNGTTASAAAPVANSTANSSGRGSAGGGKKTKGRVKIKMEFIDNKLRRYTTFSKRKTGIMKKAYELSTLTGTQVMLLVASETGHVYTFATRKLQPMITSDAGKALIQTCLNSPDPSALMTGSGSGSNNGADVITTNGHISQLVGNGSGGSSNGSVGGQHSLNGEQQQQHNSDLSRMLAAQAQSQAGGPTGSLSGCSTPNTLIDQRMSATGFEETELSYSVNGDDCSPLNDKSFFNNINLSNNLVNNSLVSNGHLLRVKGSTLPQTNFFINETPELGQCSDDDDDDEEEDEDEDMDEGEEDIDPEIDSDMAYLSGLQSMDPDLTRLITGSAVGATSSTPILLNENMIGSAMWPTVNQQTMAAKPGTTGSSGQQQQQCTGTSSAFISDRTKLSLNLKLQQKQQMQQKSQQQQMRSANSQALQQRPSQPFNVNFQGPKQSNTTSKGSQSLPKLGTTSTAKGFNSKKPTNSKSSGKSAGSSTSTSNSNCSNLMLNASSGMGASMNSTNSSFVNFDPASFLDSCFNITATSGNVSPESTLMLDNQHSSLDQMLLNNSELLMLNQPNSAFNQTLTTEQLMMMIGSQGQMSGQYNVPTSKTMSFGHSSGAQNKSPSKNSNNRSAPASSQICSGVRTSTTSLHNQINSLSFSSSPSKQHSNSSHQQSVLGSNFSNTSNSGHFGNLLSKQQQQHLVSSSASSHCPTTSTVLSTFGNKAQSVAQSKAANLNAIINNLASANNGATSVGASGSHNSTLDGNSNSQQQQSGQCEQTNRSGNLLDHASTTTRPNSVTFGNAQQNNGNNFRSTVAAAQQLLSGSANTFYSTAGNIIFCTNTPTSSTVAFPSAPSHVDQQTVQTSLANNSVSTNTTQIFSFPPGLNSGLTSGAVNGATPTTLLLPANLHTSGGQLSIQQPVGSGAGGNAQQLIYNAFSRFIYPSTPHSNGQSQVNFNNKSMEIGSGALTGDAAQTISTLISHDGQLYQLNVPNNSANPIAQIVTPNLPLELSSPSSRLRVKAECHSESSNSNSTISLVQPNTTLLHSDLQSLDSLLGSGLSHTQNPLITTFQPTFTPISASSSNTFANAKPQAGFKRQRSK